MAVQDKYITTNLAAGKKENAALVTGVSPLALPFTFEVAAADTDESVYRIGKIGANTIPVKCDIWCDAAIDSTDLDLGVYKPGVGGAVVDIDLFANGLNVTAGVAITTAGGNNGLTNLGGSDPLANVGKKVWELLGLTVPNRQDYDLAITLRVAGGAAGTISGIFWYLPG